MQETQKPRHEPTHADPATRHGVAGLALVRHGESKGNVADAVAREAGASRLELDIRDADVELSETGEQQAAAVGRHLAKLDPEDRPTVILTSPYRRAADTAAIAVRDSGLDLQVMVDERLRERDLGAFDGLTKKGIEEAYPDEATHRGKVGKFYYRPPGGESWTDVALRIRSLLRDLRDEFPGERVWLFTHQAVIMNFRFVLERMSEKDLLEADHSEPVANCSITTYLRSDDGRLELTSYGDTTAVDASTAETTQEQAAEEPADAAT